MALLNKDSKYIRVKADGSYEIYPDQESRDRVKNATPFEDINNKYNEILDALFLDYERQYYDSENWNREFQSWDKEHQQYLYDYEEKHGPTSYPLMKQYYADVADSIPNVIESGSIVLNTDTAEEIYNIAKERKYWGGTEDV